jgi:uncharacterized membrane protein
MTTQILAVSTLLSTGIVAGVFFAIMVSVLPTLFAMAPPQYIWTHQRLGKGYHPTMPLLVTAALGCDAALAILTDDGPERALLGTAALLLVGVQVVSQFGNVPLNRVIHRTSPDAPLDDWRDPRAQWRRWHLIRTVCALLALAATATAVTVVG